MGPLKSFYDSVVASAILYGVVCWSSSITERERKKLDKVIKKSSSVLRCPLDSVQVVGDRRVLAKLTTMLDYKSHPLQVSLSTLESSFSDRLIHPRCMKERFRRSYLPAAIRLFNNHETLLSIATIMCYKPDSSHPAHKLFALLSSGGKPLAE